MTNFTSLRARLVGTVFVALVPAWVAMYLFTYDPPWMRFATGLIALGAAWYGGERFILRQVRRILQASRLLASGDLTVRTGLDNEEGELGDLARDIDSMAASLQQRAVERERIEQDLVNRALQQTDVSGLGQYALQTEDFPGLLQYASMMISQTLKVEYSEIQELQEGEKQLKLVAGVGWKSGLMDTLCTPLEPGSRAAYILDTGDPLVIRNLLTEQRFAPCALLNGHGVRSGISVPIAARGDVYGILGAYTTNDRRFNDDEIYFLMAVAMVLSMAVARKRTEREREKLASFARLNPIPAMELDKSQRVTYSNDAARALALSMGRLDAQGILPSDFKEIASECLISGRPLVNYETVLEGRTLSWSFHPVASSATIHAYVQDITARLDLEEQLRQSQKMECIGQLAAGVAHDFNNMLTIIQGHSGLLIAKPNLPEELREGAQAVYFAAERAAALTRQLLMFARKNVVQLRPLDLTEVTVNTSKLLQRLLGETIKLEMDCPEGLSGICGDPGMIEQVIMNLAVNARDAMPRGGVLRISAREQFIGQAYVQANPESTPGEHVCLTIEDTGSGIDPETLPKIFEPFFTTKAVGKGTGLGLATVYGIMKQHSGWIDVQSEVGRGTAFTLYFPCANANGKCSSKTQPPETAMQSGCETILLVEDELVLREMAKAILQDCGYQVIDAGSGVEALKIWDSIAHTVDLLLTDMVMPDGVSGMDLATQLRESKPSLKIIFASGYSMDDLDMDFLRKGYASFLQKPYTHVTLSQAVRECLDKSPVASVRGPASLEAAMVS